MTKRSTPSNLGRAARKRVHDKPVKAISDMAALAAAPDPNAPDAQPQMIPEQPEITPEQVNEILHRQVAVARQAFFRLASVRAADLVKFEGKSWDDGGDYINREMQGLDQQLAAVVKGQ